MTDRIDGARTFKEAVYNRLAGMIRELELAPGARLVESDLAERLSVSKTPIREALLLLERDGLVELVPHTGATVTWPSILEYEDVQLVLDAAEQPSLATVAERLTPKHLQVLDRNLDRCRKARADADSRRFFASTLELHKHMFGSARSDWLTHVVETTLLHARRYERVFIHQYDDTWDIELKILEERLSHVRSGETEAAAVAVSDGHAELLRRFRERARDPKVARFLPPVPETADMGGARGPRKSRGRGQQQSTRDSQAPSA